MERPSEQISKTRERKHIGKDGGDRVAAKKRWREVKGGRLQRRHAHARATDAGAATKCVLVERNVGGERSVIENLIFINKIN